MKTPSRTGRKPSKRGICQRCPAQVFGQQQVCDGCRAKELLCQAPGCGKPHGGQSFTTRLCRKCRADRLADGRGRPGVNPPFSEADDAKIRAAYGDHHARAAMDALVKLLPQQPRWAIKRRAILLGAATVRKKEPPWSAEEDAFLAENGWMLPQRLWKEFRKRGFKRTLAALVIRKNRKRVRSQIDGMTCQSLAGMLGVDIKTAMRWIEKGWIKATRAGTTGDNHDRWFITTEAVRAFLFEHYEQVELSKLERVGSKMWFLDLVTGGRISEDGAPSAPATVTPIAPAERKVPLAGEQVTIAALAEISGRPVAELLRRLDALGMSVEQAAFGDVETPAPAKVELSPLAASIVEQLRALMKMHKAKPADLARWAKLPVGVVDQVLAGQVPLVSAALLGVLEQLDGEVEVKIGPRRRSYLEAS